MAEIVDQDLFSDKRDHGKAAEQLFQTSDLIKILESVQDSPFQIGHADLMVFFKPERARCPDAMIAPPLERELAEFGRGGYIDICKYLVRKTVELKC